MPELQVGLTVDLGYKRGCSLIQVNVRLELGFEEGKPVWPKLT